MIISENVVGRLAWIIARKMNLLRWKIDRFKRFPRLRRRQTFLAPHDRAFQCTFERAVDPDANIEVLSISWLKKKDSLEQHDVDLAERVAMSAEIRRSFSGEIRFHIDAYVCLAAVTRPARTFHRIGLRSRKSALPDRAIENGHPGD